jgi:hypothetical protein
MDWWAVWQSVAALRRIEFVTILITMIVPLLGGSVLLSVRFRIKALLDKSSETHTGFYQGNLSRRDYTIQVLREELQAARGELTSFKSIHSPRHLSAAQVDLLVEKLRGIKAAPIIVSAYAFEQESASYASQIAAALRQADLTVTLNKASMNDFKGLSLGSVALMHQPLDGLHELAAAFTEAHLDLRQREINLDSIAGPLQDGSLLVIVGRQ